MRLPGMVVRIATAVVALSVVGVLVVAAVFVTSSAWLLDRLTLDGLLWLSTAMLAALAASSGLLLLHLHSEETYTSFEKTVLTLCLGFSLSILALLVLMVALA